VDLHSKHIDEVFRKKFENFEVVPPESVWDKIKAGLPGGTSGTLFSNPISLASMAAVILIALMVGLNIMKQPDKAMMFLLEGPHAATQKEKITPPVQTIDTEQQSTPATTLKENTIAKADIPPATEVSPGPPTSFGKQFKDPEPENTIVKPEPFSTRKINVNEEISSSSLASPTLINNPDNRSVVYKGDYINRKSAQWTLGFYFTPEVVIYPQDNVQNQSAYHLDFSAALNFNEFIIESGIGLNFSKDDGAYKYDYEQYLGTYDDVYLVTFDSTENGVIPTYHTQPVDVYDSIREVFKPTKNRYTYLEIPLLFGFRKQVNRLSWVIKAGPAVDLLIYESIGGQGQTEKDRFTLIENEQPKRINAYWQVMFSAGINYKVGKHISLAFEPVFRYYLLSGYEKAYIQSRHPYAIGLRAGVLYNF